MSVVKLRDTNNTVGIISIWYFHKEPLLIFVLADYEEVKTYKRSVSVYRITTTTIHQYSSSSNDQSDLDNTKD